MNESVSSSPAAAWPKWLWPTLFALLGLVLALVVVLLLARMQSLEGDVARRLAEIDRASTSLKGEAAGAASKVGELATRTAALESQAQEAQSQQVALASMYQELARGQDERLLADMEHTLLLAQQQLYLTGNVRTAILGLEAASARLNRLNRARFEPLRNALAHDLERLRLSPAADTGALRARLDALIDGVDAWGLESEPEPEAAHSTPAARPEASSPAAPGDWLWRYAREAWDELRALVRIRRLDHPDLPLLTPEQQFFLRENLKLRLLSARMAAFARDEATWQADLKVAGAWLLRYFNPRDPAVKAASQSIAELTRAELSLQGVDLNASLKALAVLRPGGD